MGGGWEDKRAIIVINYLNSKKSIWRDAHNITSVASVGVSRMHLNTQLCRQRTAFWKSEVSASISNASAVPKKGRTEMAVT